MIRLGIAIRTLGKSSQPALAGAAAHLSIGALGLRDTLLYLVQQRVGGYRLADTLLPRHAQADQAAAAAQIDACSELLAEVGALAHAAAIRLSFHPGLYTALATEKPDVAARAACDIVLRARLLDRLGCGPEGVIVLHAGGAHGDQRAALRRFAACYERLPAAARARVVVEPDEHCFDLAALLGLHQCCGVPIVFDTLHFQLNNPQRMALAEALGLALATWPAAVRPKIHFSSQRTEAHLREARGGQVAHIVAPRRGQHADFVNPFEFAQLITAAHGLPAFDIMLEAKAADLALLRLRDDLRDFAPAAAARVQ